MKLLFYLSNLIAIFISAIIFILFPFDFYHWATYFGLLILFFLLLILYKVKLKKEPIKPIILNKLFLVNYLSITLYSMLFYISLWTLLPFIAPFGNINILYLLFAAIEAFGLNYAITWITKRATKIQSNISKKQFIFELVLVIYNLSGLLISPLLIPIIGSYQSNFLLEYHLTYLFVFCVPLFIIIGFYQLILDYREQDLKE
ncbi:hypothetical protein [Acholeplasma equifetale]|uniref:hypothetical protein n=1 Tax=Acholeplasma equifetale TaxID=264634 RepID=UPI00047977CB|nr:hypothetical protein [Acholeplasma equifetale]